MLKSLNIIAGFDDDLFVLAFSVDKNEFTGANLAWLMTQIGNKLLTAIKEAKEDENETGEE